VNRVTTNACGISLLRRGTLTFGAGGYSRKAALQISAVLDEAAAANTNWGGMLPRKNGFALDAFELLIIPAKKTQNTSSAILIVYRPVHPGNRPRRSNQKIRGTRSVAAETSSSHFYAS